MYINHENMAFTTKLEETEWLETNGLGGWASSTITGCNTRRYHGLLVAATKPPTERIALISKLDETILVGGERFELGTNRYSDVIHPKGFQHLRSFQRKLFPHWEYEVRGIRLKKTIAMINGENTTVILYDVLRSPTPFELELLPLISARSYHSLQHNYNNIWWDIQFENGVFRNHPNEHTIPVFISVPGASYHHEPCWFNSFRYSVEQYRGLDFEEDLFNHGKFTVTLKEGDSLGIILSTNNPTHQEARELLEKEEQRRQSLLNHYSKNQRVQQLLIAADQFIVKRHLADFPGDKHGEEAATIIAGYHWFTDWGRDTMISLPGLCLATGRYDDAKKILEAFGHAVSMGMIPNRFQDNGEEPEYNNVDGTLWFFIAIHKYLASTNDTDFILREILPVLKDIIDWHIKGTRYSIHETEDGLLFSGEPGIQLTWMDAKIGDWVVTPRTGKAVEVNALWYNALCIYAELLHLNNEHDEAEIIRKKSFVTRESFSRHFWNEQTGCLFDVIDDNNKDDTIRPNQLFAISLPFPLIDGSRVKSILKVITEKLYTPVGLRSLPVDHPGYSGIYGGNALQRDSAYHQGTVWSWLIGPYIDALVKGEGEDGLKKGRHAIEAFLYHLDEACIGTVSEIFDGNAPHHPRGCAAQAWGVAELLRVIIEYGMLRDTPLTQTEMQDFIA